MIIPSCTSIQAYFPFTVTIYSSTEVELKQLSDVKYVAHSGEWTAKTAGGCHLYSEVYEKKEPKWKFNPKYQLILKGTGESNVKIILNRPEKSWSHKVAKDPVKCMIGFYVFQICSNNMLDINMDKVKNHPVFVPMNEQSEELKLPANSQGYIVMPTTYEVTDLARKT